MLNETLDEEVVCLTEAVPKPHVLAGEIFRRPCGELPMAEPVSLPETTMVCEAAAAMKSARSTFVLLTDARGRLSGIFTARDALLRLGDVPIDAAEMPIARYMTHGPDRLQADHPIAYALNFMHMGGHRHVPIVDGDDKPIGVIGTREVVAWLSEYFREEVLNLPPDPSHPEPLQVDGA